MLRALTPTPLFDALGIQVDGPKAWDEKLTIDVVLQPGDTNFAIVTP
ncbi:alkyl sulfatase C-terminal domain-containing protein [Isoptericola croceus]|nr:alkyl sulfatase C-terminal domain-containing protein [Isoptericola croceus]